MTQGCIWHWSVDAVRQSPKVNQVYLLMNKQGPPQDVRGNIVESNRKEATEILLCFLIIGCFVKFWREKCLTWM